MTGIGQQFMEKTRYAALGPSDQKRGMPQPPIELERPRDVVEEVALPAPETLELGRAPLCDVVSSRRSLREYSPQPLSIAELSYLLWSTQGVREIQEGRFTLRNVPSAGARHPFETLLLLNRVEGVSAGLHRYLATQHRLLRIPAPVDVASQLALAALGQDMVRTCAVAFIWIAVPERTTWRYGERGYRYLHLDAGHVAQNLYLAAESIGAGACAIAAFSDEAMNELLHLDGTSRFTIYLAAVGKRPRAKAD